MARRLLALLKLMVLWAVPWTIAGLVVGGIRWATGAHWEFGLVNWLATHTLAFGTLGLLSGLNLGLLLARAERGKSVEQIRPGRLVLWAAIGGFAPAVLFAGLALVFGAPGGSFLPLLVLGGISAGLSAAVMRATVGRRSLGSGGPAGRLPSGS